VDRAADSGAKPLQRIVFASVESLAGLAAGHLWRAGTWKPVRGSCGDLGGSRAARGERRSCGGDDAGSARLCLGSSGFLTRACPAAGSATVEPAVSGCASSAVCAGTGATSGGTRAVRACACSAVRCAGAAGRTTAAVRGTAPAAIRPGTAGRAAAAVRGTAPAAVRPGTAGRAAAAVRRAAPAAVRPGAAGRPASAVRGATAAVRTTAATVRAGRRRSRGSRHWRCPCRSRRTGPSRCPGAAGGTATAVLGSRSTGSSTAIHRSGPRAGPAGRASGGGWSRGRRSGRSASGCAGCTCTRGAGPRGTDRTFQAAAAAGRRSGPAGALGRSDAVGGHATGKGRPGGPSRVGTRA
jgi:hypothetical protein